MSKFVSDRIEIIKKILEIINPEFTEDDVNRARVTWWQNIRSTGGLQLTEWGDDRFRLAELEYYDIDCGPTPERPKFLTQAVTMNKKIQVPFYRYFKDRRMILRVYDGRVALAIGLYDNLEEYLKSLDE